MRKLLLSVILFSCIHLQAQVWTLDAKTIYASISYSTTHYSEKFDSTGESVPLPNGVDDKTISLFAQYGLTKNFTVQLNLPFKFVSIDNGMVDGFTIMPQEGLFETGKLNALGNIEFGGIYKLIDDKPFLTASFFVEANTSDRNYLSGLQTGFNSWGFKPGLGVGWGFSKSWFTFYGGGDIRTNNYSSSILSNVELGYKPVEYLYFAALLNLKQSLENGGDCDCTTQYTALYLNNQEYFAATIKSGFTVGRWGLNVAYSAGLMAKNLPYSGIATVGVQFKSK